jgi:D-arabinose 1-dehydrogenase-like Zn-dependent alcohol dehydrogenase
MGMVKVVGASSGRPEEMERAIEFSHDNNIACIVDARPIDQYQQMVNDMRAGQVAKGRMIVTF